MDGECVFCKIVKKEMPAYRVYDDAEFLAFLDIRPLNGGHVVVIPKKHYRWVWDVPKPGEYFKVVDRIANALKKAMDTEWIVSYIIGEAMPHAHIHLLPRFPDDGHGNAINFGAMKEIPKEQMDSIKDRIKNALLI
ncbi:MAG: HIT family protein [Candidatus Aenigmatarchaeota archaeon]